MLNPFINLNSTVVELELKRRQRFKVGVYSFLMATLLFLMGLLIQGCRAEQKSDSAGARQVHPTETVNNAVASSTVASTPRPQPDSKPSATVSPETRINASTQASSDTNLGPAPTSGISQAPVSYVVKSGDTLSAIAKEHGTTVRALRSVNSLKSDHLTVGKELKLPSTALVSLAK